MINGQMGNTGSVKKAGEMVIRARRAGPGVCAAASPGDGGQKRKVLIRRRTSRRPYGKNQNIWVIRPTKG